MALFVLFPLVAESKTHVIVFGGTVDIISPSGLEVAVGDTIMARSFSFHPLSSALFRLARLLA
jgi:hypothetical protein